MLDVSRTLFLMDGLRATAGSIEDTDDYTIMFVSSIFSSVFKQKTEQEVVKSFMNRGSTPQLVWDALAPVLPHWWIDHFGKPSYSLTANDVTESDWENTREGWELSDSFKNKKAPTALLYVVGHFLRNFKN